MVTQMPSMRIRKYLFLLILATAPCQAVEKITVVGLFKDKAIVSIDGKQRVLTAGKPSPEGVTLISSNSREAVLELDGEQNTYVLGEGTQIGGNYTPPVAGATTTLTPDALGHYVTSGSINGFQMRFIVDTGASLVAMNRNHAKRIGLNYKLDGKESRATTAAGITTIYLMNLDTVRIGDIELQNVTGAIHDDEFPEDILLGNSFLNRVKMNRDGELLVLEKK